MSSYTVLETIILNKLYSFEKELFSTKNLELAKKIAIYYAKKKYGDNIIEKKQNKKIRIPENSILFYTDDNNYNCIYSIIENK